MEKKIMYTEYEPDKKFLWLHTKNNNLVLEVYGDNGWESVGDDNEQSTPLPELVKSGEGPNLEKSTIRIRIPKLTENSTKKSFITAVEKLKEALVKAGIIELY